MMDNPVGINQRARLDAWAITSPLQVFLDLLSRREPDIPLWKTNLIDFARACDTIGRFQERWLILWGIRQPNCAYVLTHHDRLAKKLLAKFISVDLGVDNSECPQVIVSCSW